MKHNPVIRVKKINGKNYYTIGVISHAHQLIANATEEQFIEDGGWSIFEPEPPVLYSGDSRLTEPEEFINIKKNIEVAHLISPVTSGIIYHYTSWNTLFSGIMSQKNINDSIIQLRAYNLSFMNDKSEGSVLLKAKAESRCYDNLPSSFAEDITETEIRNNRKNLFATCFTKNIDSLPMWNYYGLNGKGIAIGLDAGEIWNQGFLLYDCIYGDEALELADYPLCQVMSDTSYGSDYKILFGIAKDPHYSYEGVARTS